MATVGERWVAIIVSEYKNGAVRARVLVHDVTETTARHAAKYLPQAHNPNVKKQTGIVVTVADYNQKVAEGKAPPLPVPE